MEKEALVRAPLSFFSPIVGTYLWYVTNADVALCNMPQACPYDDSLDLFVAKQ